MNRKASFIGLGTMGSLMALNLLKQGVELSVYNRSKEKAAPLVNAGAKLLNYPCEAFEYSPIVFSMVANDQALNEITEGSKGILEGAKPGSIHVSLSTVSPVITSQLTVKHQEKGVKFLASPVFGRPDVAANHALWICVAGDESAKELVKPFLQMLGKKVYDFGPRPEIANIVKITGNFMMLSIVELLSEALTFAEKNGVNPKDLYSLLIETLFPSPVFATYGKLILEQEFNSTAGFKMSLGLKDIDLFLRTAEASHVPTPIAGILHDRLLSCMARGREELDWSAISMVSREEAGF